MKLKNSQDISFFQDQISLELPGMLFFMLINVKMPTIVEHGFFYITSGPGGGR